jgi:hypothetical protein
MGLTIEAIDKIRGKYYHTSQNDENAITSYDHYIQIRGAVRCFGRETRDLVQVDFFEKIGRLWNSIKMNVPFEKLGRYVEIQKEDLPWNRGEGFWTERETRLAEAIFA